MTATEDERIPEPEPTRRRRYNLVLLIVLGVVLAGVVAFAVLRFVVSGVFGVDGGRFTAAALALTPSTVPVGVLLAALAFLGRKRLMGALALVLAVVLAVPLVPRVVADTGPVPHGPTVRVLAFNLYFGQADAETVVDLVAEHRVDVLMLTELDAEAVAELDRAGLRELLPHRILRPDDGGAGSGIASRYPLEELSLAGSSHFEQPSARFRIAGQDVEAVTVHPKPPVTDPVAWRSELNGLPEATPDGAVRILAGDFNATLDHARFRAVLGDGYVDAAEQRGKALVPTWPRERFGPPVTLDHVLVDERAAVRSFSVHDVPGSDHRAVLAQLRLPAAG